LIGSLKSKISIKIVNHAHNHLHLLRLSIQVLIHAQDQGQDQKIIIDVIPKEIRNGEANKGIDQNKNIFLKAEAKAKVEEKNNIMIIKEIIKIKDIKITKNINQKIINYSLILTI
jgi:hypothetical protein